MTQHQETHTPHTALHDTILEKIEHEHITQVPRWQFTVGEYTMWFLWAVSVCMGALAFSVIIFSSVHVQYAPYEATHNDAFGFFLAVMPSVWVGAFILMALLAHYNLRHTKRGYTFPVYQVLLSSLVVSIMGGFLLHTAGIGFKVDHLIATKLPFFPTLSVQEARMWQHPSEGRMIGTFKGASELPHVIVFTDIEGQEWKLNTQELNPRDIETLYNEKKVRILGLLASSSNSFYGCGVFPWVLDRNVTRAELKKEREHFIERIREHHQNVVTTILAGEPLETIPQTRCAAHEAVLRIKKSP